MTAPQKTLPSPGTSPIPRQVFPRRIPMVDIPNDSAETLRLLDRIQDGDADAG
jgi:hypothetical protein